MICEYCSETVRFGWRHSRPGWWHREDPSHESAAPRVSPVNLSPDPIPKPELSATPVTIETFPPRSGIRQICNLALKHGWKIASLTKSRGPYLGSKGVALGSSDAILLRIIGPMRLDESVPIAVASWRNGDFDFAYVGAIQDRKLHPRKVNSTGLKDWIKGGVA